MWPILKTYDQDHLLRIALPLGGIGTGTVSLGGRGDLRDWELMDKPAKGFVPSASSLFENVGPFFALFVENADGEKVTKALEGPLDLDIYEGAFGSSVKNHGLPRFRSCRFGAAYPLGQVFLSDPAVPILVRLEAFNPLIPGDADSSGIPVAVLRYVLTNETHSDVQATVCGSVPNFIGLDKPKGNKNEYRTAPGVRGVLMQGEEDDPNSASSGTIAISTVSEGDVSFRTTWANLNWGDSLLDFWDDFSADGRIEEREQKGLAKPMASIAVSKTVPAHGETEVTFLITWRFPNRITWTPKPAEESSCGCGCACESDPNNIGNYYASMYEDAWDVAAKTAAKLPALEEQTVGFVRAFCESDLPEVVKEAALFNLSTLRSQTCFRTPDGIFYGWEGCGDNSGCCHGSCTHVWNYEQATAFLFGDLAKTMREVEFGHATREDGHMSFRTHLPIERGLESGLAAADGQMGCIMKMYREWQLSGDDEMLRSLWPNVKKALEFCWIAGGWDADRDGVMEGCQHNTMDVEYFGPNPQMESWYLGALRSAEEMARYLGETGFADTCRELFLRGSAWTDQNLFNGDYYEHEIRPIPDESAIAPGLRVGMGAEDLADPSLQLGAGCLIDQLVGQYMSHILGLGYLLDRGKVKKTHESVMKYNFLESFSDHFNHARSFVLGEESALLMASYPKGRRPVRPFPYYSEVMTGFEYTAAVGMLYEGLTEDALRAISAIRDRYDGKKRSPFDEAECGHHYARAMASWGAVLAWTGFHYSAVERSIGFAEKNGRWFWSNGSAWGTCAISGGGEVELSVIHGKLEIGKITLGERSIQFGPTVISAGEARRWSI